jgi:hypothetical protein
MKTITLNSALAQLKNRYLSKCMVAALALLCFQGASAQVAMTLVTDDRNIQTKGVSAVSPGFGQDFDEVLNVADYFYDQYVADMHATQFSTIRGSKISGNGSASIEHITDPARSSTAKSNLKLAFTVTHSGSYTFTASCTGGHTAWDYAQLRTSSGKVLAKAASVGNAAANGILTAGTTYHIEAACYAKDVDGWYSGSWRFDLNFFPSVSSIAIHRTTLGMTATLACVGTPGSRCSVQRAVSLDGPWDTMDTIAVPADGDGSFNFEDKNPPATAAFYRLIEQ